MQPTDTQLLLACRGGDDAAWEALVYRYQRLIYAIPRRAGLNDDQAADIFQEVFATLFQKLDDLEEPEKLQAWLVTTARRKTWRLISKERFLQQVSIDDVDADNQEWRDIPDAAVLPEEELLRLEAQHRVRTALGAIDERCRRLLIMLFFESESISYAEIAARLGVPEGSIGPTRARCLKKLMRELDD